MDESRRQILLVFSGILGLLVGSFLNVCIFRLPRNCMSLVKPRSRCPKCLRPIAWHDNIPVLSWLVLGGKCRACRATISPRYALVELLTGALFLYAGHRQLYGPAVPGFEQAVVFALHAWFLGALIVSTFIDLDLRILPDEITISGVGIGLAASTIFPFLQPAQATFFREPWLAGLFGAAVGALVGGGVIKVVGVLGELAFRKEAMGGGDVKFMAMVGAVLGWKGVLWTFMLACLLGSVFGIGKYVAVRRMGYVPFGPFLSGGALVMLLWQDWVAFGVRWYVGLFQSGPP